MTTLSSTQVVPAICRFLSTIDKQKKFFCANEKLEIFLIFDSTNQILNLMHFIYVCCKQCTCACHLITAFEHFIKPSAFFNNASLNNSLHKLILSKYLILLLYERVFKNWVETKIIGVRTKHQIFYYLDNYFDQWVRRLSINVYYTNLVLRPPHNFEFHKF